MTIAAHIGELVRHNEMVIVPGLGAFLTQFHPAKVNALSKKINAPGKHIVFNSLIKDNDGMLAYSFAKKYGIEYKDALQIAETFSQFCLKEMKEGKQISFAQLGVLAMNQAGHIEFSADLTVNYDDRYFGLPEIIAIPIARNRKYEPVIQIHPHAKEKVKRFAPLYRRIAAVAVPFLLVGVLVWLSRDGIRNYWQQSASVLLIDSSNQFEAETAQAENKVVEFDNSESQNSPIIIEEYTAAAATLDENLDTSNETISDEAPPTAADEKDSNLKSEAVYSGEYHIIGGAFRNKDLADRLVAKLKIEGYGSYIAGQTKGGLHRVSIANHTHKNKAIEDLFAIKQKVNKDAWLLKD
jgi:cell division septation protein DedD